VGNSSGDENGSDSMKWEVIADKLSAADWSWAIAVLSLATASVGSEKH